MLGLGQPLAVGCSLRAKPRWLGPPPSTRVLLLFPSVSGLLSGRLKLGTFFFFCNFSFSLPSLDRPTDVGTELSTGTTGSSQVPSSLPFFSKRASALVI